MPKISVPHRLSRLLGLAALLSVGFFVAGVTPVQADPPSHAKAKGWHKKQAKKHKNVNACRDDRDNRTQSRYRRDDRRYDTRYDDRYEDDYRPRQDQERRRWEEEQRRREGDRYYNDRYDDRSSRSGGSLEDLAGVFLGGGGDLGGLLGGNRGGGLGDLLGGNRSGSLGGLLGGLKARR